MLISAQAAVLNAVFTLEPDLTQRYEWRWIVRSGANIVY